MVPKAAWFLQQTALPLREYSVLNRPMSYPNDSFTLGEKANPTPTRTPPSNLFLPSVPPNIGVFWEIQFYSCLLSFPTKGQFR